MRLYFLLLYSFLLLLKRRCTAIGQRLAIPNEAFCSAPPELENGRYTPEGSQYEPGQTVTYSCNDGFFLHGTVTENTCQVEGIWIYPSLTSLNIACIRLLITFPSSTNLVTVPNNTTTQTSSYSTGAAECTNQPPMPDNGGIVETITLPVPINTEVSYQCDDGRTLVGSDTNTCNAGDTWQNDAPTCEGCLDIPLPPSLFNKAGLLEIIFGEPPYPLRFRVTLQCAVVVEAKYIFLSAPFTNRCVGDLMWSIVNPICEFCSMNPCDVNAACVDTDISFSCACNPGFTGNGFSCTLLEDPFKLFVDCMNETSLLPIDSLNTTSQVDEVSEKLPCNDTEEAFSQAIIGLMNGTLSIEVVLSSLSILASLPQNATKENVDLLGTFLIDVEEATSGQPISMSTLNNVANIANNLFERSAAFFSTGNNALEEELESTEIIPIFSALNRFISRLQVAEDNTTAVNLILPTIVIQAQFVSGINESGANVSSNYADLTFTSNVTDVAVIIPSLTVKATVQNSKNGNVIFYSSVLRTQAFMLNGSKESQVVNVGGNNETHAYGKFTISFSSLNARRTSSVPSNNLQTILEQAEIFDWNGTTRQWQEAPECDQSVRRRPHLQYECNRFSSFAVFFTSRIVPSTVALSFFTWIGGGISAVCLLATIVIYLKFAELRQKPTTGTLLNICVCLLVALVFYLGGIGSTANKETCDAITAILQYAFLCSWLWMCVNAFNMYKAFTTMTFEVPKNRSLFLVYLFSYGLPLIVVLLTYFIGVHVYDTGKDQTDIYFESAYRSRHACWLQEGSLYFGFLLPVGIALLFNLVIFAFLIQKLTCHKSKIRSTKKGRSTSQKLLNASTLVVMMGLPWVFGYLLLITQEVVYQSVIQWIFTLLNLFQGVIIFILNCVRRQNIRKLWLPCSVSTKKSHVQSFSPHSNETLRTDTTKL